MTGNRVFRLIKKLVRQAARDRLVRRVSYALSCFVVFMTAYMLILPAITLSGRYPVLTAEEHTAEAGEALTVHVHAEAPEGSGSRVIALVLGSWNAGLSERYVFDEEGKTAITDTAGEEFFLHRSARAERTDIIDYWFELPEGETAEFDLELQDRISVDEVTEAARKAGFLTPEGTWETATASSAEDSVREATPSGAHKGTPSDCKKASGSDADRAGTDDEDEEGKLQDGEVLNDLGAEQEVPETEITATLLVRAGSGDTLQAAVRDAEKNAEKRGDAAAEFQWTAELSYDLLKAIFRQSILAGDGRTYQVTVTYGIDAGIPEDAGLIVSELVRDDSDVPSAVYDDYVSRAEQALGMEEGTAASIRLFDIRINDQNGEKVEIQAPVSVEILLLGDNGTEVPSPETQVVHFADGSGTPDVIDSVEVSEAGADKESDGKALTFDTTGFSVYAIVDAPAPAPSSGWHQVSTLQDFADICTAGVYVKNPSGYYFTNTQYKISNVRTGIKKTKPPASTPESANGAVLYYFEPAEGENQYKAWCYSGDNEPKYVKQQGNSLSLTTEADATVFTVGYYGNAAGSFQVQGNDGYYWNMQGGANGNAFAAYNTANDGNNRLQMEYYIPPQDDPYDLDGKTFGIAFHDNAVTSAAMTATPKTVGSRLRLESQAMLMKPDVLNNNGILLVAADSDIQEWTFVSIGSDQYYITTTVEDEVKYLTIHGANLTLEDAPDGSASVIRAIPGTGENTGKWHFTSSGYSLNLAGTAADGFNCVTGSGANTWLNLVEESVLTENDFRQYRAKKVSVSDTENVHDKSQVIVYTRIWNNTTKKYEFYIVDHDGSLVRCYDDGDGIEWVGTQVNTTLWDFTEYTNTDGTPNYYYELGNTQYGRYIAPQLSNDEILSDSPIGINMNGRRYGENSTTIIAWDQAQYSYSGLKVENGRAVPCPLAESIPFYFAIMDPYADVDRLTTADTIDSDAYGITMQMINFDNGNIGTADSPRDAKQNPFFGGNTDTAGLLSTALGGDDYPETTALTHNEGHSLGELFDDMTPVNHLFIESVYNESGYFEYDSTSNFAHLNENGDFTVYNALGAVGDYYRNTNQHGQFLPYDDLTYGTYCTFTNQTDVLAQSLPDMDPRKGERLYNVGNRSEVTYNFGMEMSAGFSQTADGLDARGHDIIFEFSGDDDFWLYVDGELVLDLGGIHSAMTGSINFRTGDIKSKRGDTTLYNVFRANYTARGMSEAEISELLNEKFETKTVDGRSVHVFRDYTQHTMKMFYMERGAGASNLRMRFNLAAVKPGTVALTKTLSGTENDSNSLLQFPYQIYYREAGSEDRLRIFGEDTMDRYNVTYKDTTRNVRYKRRFTVGNATYDHVFLLKPGETAIIDLPDDTTEYYIKECGIDPEVFDSVTVNGAQPEEHVNEQDNTLTDYASTAASMDARPEVKYENHVREGAMGTLSVTKKLYDMDGQRLLTKDDDPTPFNIRLFLGDRSADEDTLPMADHYPYFIKDPSGHYCRWNAGTQQFESLPYTDYTDLAAYLSTLTPAQKEAVIFRTSMYGSVSMLPAGYTVEFRDLVIGTKWRVEEWSSEIPKGYTMRLEDGYTRTDCEPDIENKTEPIRGIMEEGVDPAIDIRNQRGWGLTVEKVWTDRDFMTMHDPVYFAVFRKESTSGQDEDPYQLLPGTVRKLMSGQESIYYFFDNLKPDTPFSDYRVFEVTAREVEGPGGETTYTDVTRLKDGDKLTIGGTPVGGTYTADSFEYTVTCEMGEQTTQNQNVRTDTVTNARPGIRIVKKDRKTGEALPGAVFTLTGSESVAPDATYTTGEDGLVTTISPVFGETYTLTETSTPAKYTADGTAWKITAVREGVGEPTVTVTPPEGAGDVWSGSYSIETDAGDDLAIITIWNVPYALTARKTTTAGNPLPGARFALYRQVTAYDGTPRPDYTPIPGYEDLVSGDDGVIPSITEDLPKGTYYIRETHAPFGFSRLSDVCFTISETGKVTCSNNWVTSETADSTRNITLTVPNNEGFEFSAVKIWHDAKGNSTSWLKGNDDGDIPLSFTLKRRDYHGTEDEAFEATVTATTTGITVIPDDAGYIGFITGNHMTGYRITVAGLERESSPGHEWTYFMTEDVPAGSQYSAVYMNTGSDTGVTEEIRNNGSVVNTITNRRIKLLKVDKDSPDATFLPGAQFDVFTDEALTQPASDAYGHMLGTLTSGPDGMADLGDLPLGTYYVSEISAPTGYRKRANAVVIHITTDGVTYNDGTAYSQSGHGMSEDAGSGVIVLKVTNTIQSGSMLPSTGGRGTLWFTVTGSMFIATAMFLLIARKQRE